MDKSFKSITRDMKISPRLVGMIEFGVSTVLRNEAFRGPGISSILSGQGIFSKKVH